MLDVELECLRYPQATGNQDEPIAMSGKCCFMRFVLEVSCLANERMTFKDFKLTETSISTV